VVQVWIPKEKGCVIHSDHPYNAPMAMGRREQQGRQEEFWIAHTELPRTAAHPFYEQLNSPRLVFAMAANRDCPPLLAGLHPSFHTPVLAISLYASAAWVLASSGSFVWLVALGSGGIALYYIGTCASLIRLRMLRPNVEALRVPLGPLLSILGIAISVAVIAGLKKSELLALGIPAIIATGDWVWVRTSQRKSGAAMQAASR